MAIFKLFFTKCKFALHIKRTTLVHMQTTDDRILKRNLFYMFAFSIVRCIGMCKCLLEIQLLFAVNTMLFLFGFLLYTLTLLECKVDLFLFLWCVCLSQMLLFLAIHLNTMFAFEIASSLSSELIVLRNIISWPASGSEFTFIDQQPLWSVLVRT